MSHLLGLSLGRSEIPWVGNSSWKEDEDYSWGISKNKFALINLRYFTFSFDLLNLWNRSSTRAIGHRSNKSRGARTIIPISRLLDF